MSRTKHHGDKVKARAFDGLKWNQGYWEVHGEPDQPKRKRIAHRTNWMPTPGYWIRAMTTVPQRAEVRRLISVTMKLQDYEDAPLFPLAKKPHEFYW